jgi:hypothetical protein
VDNSKWRSRFLGTATNVSLQKTWQRLLVAFFGVQLANFPLWLFIFDAASLQKVQPWTDNFRALCITDCPLYAQLAMGQWKDHVFAKVYFPTLPLLIQWTRALFPNANPYGTAVAISNAFAILAGMLALFLGDRIWKSEGRRFFFSYPSWLLLAAISFFPHHHFWLQGYTEPLFAACVLTALICLLDRRWIIFGIAAGLGAVTRPQGIWMLGLFWGYVIYLGYRRDQDVLKGRWRVALSATLSMIPLAIFLHWQWKAFGNPLAFADAQRGWGRSFSFWGGIWEHRPRWDVSVAYLYLSIAAGVSFLRRDTAWWKLMGASTLVMAQLPLFMGGFYSYVRFQSVSFGLFIFIAELSVNRPWLAISLVAWAISRLAVQAYHSGFGLWVG